MSALSQLLERLRRMQPPPGAPGSIVAVPTAGDALADEVAFLFGELDAVAEHAEAILAAARSDAAQTLSAATAQGRQLIAEARVDAESLSQQLLAERRTRSQEQARTMLADARREADRVLAVRRERIAAVVAQVIARMLETPP